MAHGTAWGHVFTVNSHPFITHNYVHHALLEVLMSLPSACFLLFSYPDVTPDISNHGVPVMCMKEFMQLTHDQQNNQLDLTMDVDSAAPRILRT